AARACRFGSSLAGPGAARLVARWARAMGRHECSSAFVVTAKRLAHARNRYLGATNRLPPTLRSRSGRGNEISVSGQAPDLFPPGDSLAKKASRRIPTTVAMARARESTA